MKIIRNNVRRQELIINFRLKRIIILSCAIFLALCHLSSQNRISRQKMDKLININSIYSVDTVQLVNERIPPPPPLTDNVSTNNMCKKKYNVPDSLFLTLYPFNADSIVIVYPDTCCDSFSRYEDFRDLFKLKKMKKEEIAFLANQLYNYNYIEKSNYRVITTYIDQIKRPDIIFLFYHNQTQNELVLYFDEYPQLRMETSFHELYWGANCSDLYNRLISFFKEEYNFTIEKCKECYLPVVLPLIEDF